MIEWRVHRGWTDAELERALARARAEPPNFDTPAERMTPAHGWNFVESEAVIGHEPPGKPVADGAFTRARRSVSRLEFSAPEIVVAHFDEQEPLRGRTVLLELKPMGLRYLCPVRIARTEEAQDERQTRFGFCFETLNGHVERGREWFWVTKEHATGEVRFRIEAAWRAGQFPNGWSWVGFQVLGRRYQRRWHHLAHRRLRRLVAGMAPELAHGLVLTHAGQPIALPEVRFRSVAGAQRQHMRRDRLLLVAGLGALSGLRSYTPIAALSLRLSRHPLPRGTWAHVWTTRPAAGVLGALAAGEWIFDKLPVAPARTNVPSLLGRMVMGALAGSVLAARGDRRRSGPALAGAVAAAAGTFASYAARQRLAARIPEPFAGLLEDAAAVGGSILIASRLDGELPHRARAAAGRRSPDAQAEARFR